VDEFLSDHELNGKCDTFSDEVRQHLDACGLQGFTLRELCEAALQQHSTLPPASNTLSVVYDHQETGERIGVDHIEYNDTWLHGDLYYYLQYWSGVRGVNEIDVVNAGEMWKCKYCNYYDGCERSPLKVHEAKHGIVRTKSDATVPATCATDSNRNVNTTATADDTKENSQPNVSITSPSATC
jgi:hypothetical protein